MPSEESSQNRKSDSDWIHDLQSPLAALRSIRSGEVTPEAEALIHGAILSLERILGGLKGSLSASESAVEPTLQAEEEWTAIDFSEGSVVAILDDDPAIHATWKKRFSELLEGSIERIVPACNPREMRLAMREFPDLFLMDHDLAGYAESGLDLIIELGIARQAWLVTGRALDPEIRARCARHGVRVISKHRLVDIPLVVVELVGK